MRPEVRPCSLGSAIVAPALALLVVLSAHDGHAECTLRGAAEARGVAVGAAVATDRLLSDPMYAPILATEFNSVTAENVMKWQATQPTRSAYTFARADQLVDFAEANGMSTRGHTLIWDQAVLDATPAWVTSITDATELRSVLADHIQTVVSRYAGRVDAWDVVNEPFETAGSTLYNNVFHELLGPGYIAEALAMARAADPEAKLFINEVLVNTPGPKFDALLALVQDLLAAGAPLDGVGIQAHLAPNATTLRQNVATLVAMGVEVELTEVDILLRGGGDLDEKLVRQGDDYLGVVSACFDVPGCTRVTFWGFTDRYTWVDSFLPGFAPLPFDVDYRRKPAWFAAQRAVDGAGAMRTMFGKQIKIIDRASDPDRHKVVIRTRDPSVAVSELAGADDPTIAGATLSLVTPGASAPVSVELAPSGWKQVSNGYRFRGDGAGSCQKIVVRAGRIKVVCAHGSLPFPLDQPAQGSVAVTLRLGCGALNCMEFGGTVVADRGKDATGVGRFVAKNADSPTSCGPAY